MWSICYDDDKSTKEILRSKLGSKFLMKSANIAAITNCYSKCSAQKPRNFFEEYFSFPKNSSYIRERSSEFKKPSTRHSLINVWMIVYNSIFYYFACFSNFPLKINRSKKSRKNQETKLWVGQSIMKKHSKLEFCTLIMTN